MKKIIYIIIAVLFINIVFAQDTEDSGFWDTGDSEALTPEDYESLTSEDLENVIDAVEDITQLNEYELNQYVYSSYEASLIMQDAVSGATLTSDGFLTNGEGGSQINLNDIPEGTMIALEQDGSITLYTSGSDSFALDLSAIVQSNAPPVTIISTDGETYLADGTILYDNAQVTVYSDILIIDGVMEYNGIEIRSRTGPVAIVQDQSLGSTLSLIEGTGEEVAGTVIMDQTSITVGNSVQVVMRESEKYGIEDSQGLIFLSRAGSVIVYENNPEEAELKMYGDAVVFDGMRLLQQNSQGQFYSLKGGGETIGEEYNQYLIEQYGYFPKQKDMTLYVYDTPDSENPEEQYKITSGTLADALLTKEEAIEGRVANYFMDPAFDQIPKKKAVLLWSSRSDDVSTFQSVILTKQQQLIEQGYAPEDIDVLHFTTDDEFFSQLDTVSGATYLEVVSHGWTDDYASMIGTEDYYEHLETEEYSERKTLAISAQEIQSYVEQRKQKTAAGEADSLVAQEGAFCTISTCHSDASYSTYDPEHEMYMGIRGDQTTVAQAFTSLGDDVHVYGTVGPLYLVGYKNQQGMWVKDLVPVSDMSSIFEGTANPGTETILTQDIFYRRLQ